MNANIKKSRIFNQFRGARYAVWVALVLLSITTITGNSYGWFSNNTNAEANGVRIQIKEDKSINVARLIVYKFKIEENRMYATVDDPTKPEYMVLNQYDTVFPERMKYTPMILKVPLELTLGETFYVSFVCKGALKGDDGKLLNELSNVIRVKCGSSEKIDNDYPSDNTEPGDTTAFYADVKGFFEKTENESSIITNEKWCEGRFVTYEVSGDTITNLQKIPPKDYPPEGAGYTYTGMIQMEATGCKTVSYDETQQVNLYMYIDYDPKLIDKFVLDNNFAFDDEGAVKDFEKDIIQVTFSKTREIPK